MQIRTTRRDHLTPDRMAVIHKPSINKCWRECGERGTLLQCGWECRLVQPLCKSLWRYLKILKMDPPLDQRSHFWNPKLWFERKYAPPCSFQCSIISPRYGRAQVSISRWVDKSTRDIYTVEYYLGRKRRRKFSPLRQCGWTWRTLCSVKYASQRKTTMIWFHSHVESNEETELIRNMGTDS